MSLAKAALEVLGPASQSEYQARIEEVHHTDKKDAPSGTALKWRHWSGLAEAEIRSERVGDAVGEHRLILEGATERLALTHQALDRAVFTDGALWAAKKLCQERSLGYGLHRFEDIAQKEFFP